MSEEKPSYMTSATSQILIITVGGYVLAAVALVVVGGIKGDLNFVRAAQGSLESLLTVVLPLYAVRKGIEAGKNGHATSPPTPPATP